MKTIFSRSSFMASVMAPFAFAAAMLLAPAVFADVSSAKSESGVVLDTDGNFKISTRDGRYEFKLGGRIHYDFWQSDGVLARTLDENAGTNGSRREDIEARRLRFDFSGKLAKVWEYKFGYDLEDASRGNNSGRGVTDAFLRYTGWGDWLNLTLGRHKPPFVMEELISSNDILTVERHVLVQAFAPGRHTGISLHGSSEQFSYQVTAFRDGGDEGENSDASFAARVTWSPLRDSDSVIHVGVSGLQRDGIFASAVAANGDLVVTNAAGDMVVAGHTRDSSVRTESRNASRVYLGPYAADGINGFGLELAFSGNGFWFLAEYVDMEYDGVDRSRSSGGVPVTTSLGADFDGYSAQLSWVLTGESRPYNSSNGTFKRITPQNSHGAWEVYARYSSLDLATGNNIDGGGISPLSPAVAFSDNYSALTYGINWYANENVLVRFNYIDADIERTRYVDTNNPPTPIVSADDLGTAALVDGDSVGVRIQYAF